MNQERFIGAVIGITTAAITLLVLGQFEREATGKVAYDCAEPTERERVRELALKGIDDGLQKAAALIYDIWRLDITPEPAKAQIGMTNAINAHHRARKHALAWQPPPCLPEK